MIDCLSGGSGRPFIFREDTAMNSSFFSEKDFTSQFLQACEIIEPHITSLQLNSRELKVGFASLLKDYIRSCGFDETRKLELDQIVEFAGFIEERFDELQMMAPFVETLRRSMARIIDAYSGRCVFIGDHNHIYQPDRFDKGFADFIHGKVSRECYEKMSRLYRFYSVDIGPTLAEWFRIRRPDIFGDLLRSNAQEPLMAQSYTHRILPLIKEEEDLRAEIMAGLIYHSRTFRQSDSSGFPIGLWLPECCISRKTAEVLQQNEVDFVILRRDQSQFLVDPGQVYRLGTGASGMKPLYAFYYHPFSKEFSFDKWTTDSPAQTLSHILSFASRDSYYLLAHDGELVHHRFEHCGVDVTGFFRELPMEIYRRNNPFAVLITPAKYLQFLHIRAFITGKELDLPVAMLPDFPTSWSCGGYALKSFDDVKGYGEDSLKEKDRDAMLEVYGEFLVLRDLQRSNNDPVPEETWKLMVKMKREELEERFPEESFGDAEKAEITADLRRGVNICYDNRRYADMKIGGAGRWAYGSLDSGDSVYQTYLFTAASLLEEQVHRLICGKTDGLFKDRAHAKAFFTAMNMESLDNLDGTPEERLRLLHEKYSKTVTPREAALFKSKDEFFREFLTDPESVDEETRREIWKLLRLWSIVRTAKTSCAYFFDDFNNHVAEDAALRIAEVIHCLEDVYRERIAREVYESLKQTCSRYRVVRGQGPEVSAYEVAMRHLNILRIQHYITKCEGITLAEFNSFLKDNQYSLPHPEGSSREYYRAFVNEALVGFTSVEGVEMLIARLSRDAARLARNMTLTVEKRDLETGEIINRLHLEARHDQLIAEKPFIASEVDQNIYLSIKIEEKEIHQVSHFVIDSVMPVLPDYGVDTKTVETIYVNRDRILLDYAEPYSRSRRKGPSRNADAVMLKKGMNIEELASTKLNLRFLTKEMQSLVDDSPGLDEVNRLWMEKLPTHFEHLMENARIKQFIYGGNGNIGLLKRIEKNPAALAEILEGGLRELQSSSIAVSLELVKAFILQRVFLFHDHQMGKYEIEQRVKNNRKISMKEAVTEYCQKEKIPYEKEMLSFKLWKYRNEEIRRYSQLSRDLEKLKRLLHQNLTVKKGDNGEACFTVITHPILYFHGAANEANNEPFYPDNEVVPRIAESHPDKGLSMCFFPGSVAFPDQYSYLKKIRRYFLEKFGLRDITGALFATGDRDEIDRTREKDQQIIVLPSLESDESLRYFAHERHREISSRHMEYQFEPERLALRNLMDECDIVYLGGGNSFLLNLRLQELTLPPYEGGEGAKPLSFKDALRFFIYRGGLLMTLSAGTLVSSTRMMNFKVKQMSLSNDFEGLNLIRGVMQVHFEEYGLMEHLHEIRTRYPELPVLGIDTLTALIDGVTLKITTSNGGGSKNGWSPDRIRNVECIDEHLTVMGSKTLTLRDHRGVSFFVDGQTLPLAASFFNC
jgi:peptidase E